MHVVKPGLAKKRPRLPILNGEEAEAEITDATSRLRAQAAAAREALTREADTLAGAVVERILGRRAS